MKLERKEGQEGDEGEKKQMKMERGEEGKRGKKRLGTGGERRNGKEWAMDRERLVEAICS